MTERTIVLCGENVTCESGHLIAVARRKVMSNDAVSTEPFQFVGNAPMRGTVVQPCHCGAQFVRGGSFGYQLHVDGEWR